MQTHVTIQTPLLSCFFGCLVARRGKSAAFTQHWKCMCMLSLSQKCVRLICFHFYLLASPSSSTQHVIFIVADQLLSILAFLCFSQTGSAPLQREWFMPFKMNERGAISLSLGAAIGGAALFWSDAFIHFEQHTWILLSPFRCCNQSSRLPYLQLSSL